MRARAVPLALPQPLRDPAPASGSALAGAFALAFAFAFAGAMQRASAQQPPEIVVTGRIVAAEDRQPLAGARATLQIELPWHHPATATLQQPPPVVADERGRFAIRCAPPAGTLALRIEADGRVPAEDFLLPLASADLGRIRLRRGLPCRGRVLDDGQRPVAGLRLRQPTGLTVRGMFAVQATAVTRADGSFTFDTLLPAGNVLPEVENEGFEMTSTPQPLTGDAPVELRVERLRSIAGVVFSRQRRPLPRVTMRAEDDAGVLRTATRADGSFVVFGSQDASERVDLLVGENGAFTAFRVPNLDWGRAGIVVEVEAPAALPLLVVERGTGAPVERFGVYVRSLAAGAVPDTRIVHGDRPHRGGRLEFAALHRGRNRVLVIPCDHALAPAELSVEADGTELGERRVEVERLGPRRVRVIDAAGLPQQVDVDVIDHRGSDHVRSFEDPRSFRWCFPDDGPVAIRLGSARIGGDGRGELLLPQPREHVEIVVRGAPDTRIPLRDLPRDAPEWELRIRDPGSQPAGPRPANIR